MTLWASFLGNEKLVKLVGFSRRARVHLLVAGVDVLLAVRLVGNVEHKHVLRHARGDERESGHQEVVDGLQVGDPGQARVDGVEQHHGTQDARDAKRDARRHGMPVYPEAQRGQQGHEG